jgi:hypothetical protein
LLEELFESFQALDKIELFADPKLGPDGPDHGTQQLASNSRIAPVHTAFKYIIGQGGEAASDANYLLSRLRPTGLGCRAPALL